MTPDEINRLWQHGLHEEGLFHQRLNFFAAMQVGLLGIFAILYSKEPAPGVLIPLTAVGLTFTLIWLWVQIRHWQYFVHVNAQIRGVVPEYMRTLAAYSAPGKIDGLSISRPLAYAVPTLFAVLWIALFTWVLTKIS